VRRDLSATRKEDLRSALLKMHEDQAGALILKEFKALKFIETRDSDFKSVYFFARELDIDLNNEHEPTVR
jgi:ABC-type phosphate/phosphonate transport system substrate-binding protein